MLMNKINIDTINEYLSYDQETGEIKWKKPPHHLIKPGDNAGFFEPRGYLVIQFKKTFFKGHRIAWAIVNNEFPSGEIDHIDGNPSNNKISNLRVVDRSKNQMNRRISTNNKSGIKGVHFCKSKQKWISRISCGKSRIHIGQFDSFDEAFQKRKEIEKNLHGQYARAI